MEDMHLVVKMYVIMNIMAVELRKDDYVGDGVCGLRKIQERNILPTSWIDLQDAKTGRVTKVRFVSSPDDHFRWISAL